MDNLQFTDNTISHIAQLLQMAMLTGTDVVDNMRAASFVVTEGKIEVSPEYFESFQQNLQRMLDQANEAVTSEEATDQDNS